MENTHAVLDGSMSRPESLTFKIDSDIIPYPNRRKLFFDMLQKSEALNMNRPEFYWEHTREKWSETDEWDVPHDCYRHAYKCFDFICEDYPCVDYSLAHYRIPNAYGLCASWFHVYSWTFRRAKKGEDKEGVYTFRLHEVKVKTDGRYVVVPYKFTDSTGNSEIFSIDPWRLEKYFSDYEPIIDAGEPEKTRRAAEYYLQLVNGMSKSCPYPGGLKNFAMLEYMTEGEKS